MQKENSLLVFRRSLKKGLSPGTLVHIGDTKVQETQITIFQYDKEKFEEKKLLDELEELSEVDLQKITWINVDGINDIELIEKIGKLFKLHPLIREDIVNTAQRPKVEGYEDHLFIVLRMLCYKKQDNSIYSEQISIVLGENLVISFQEQQGDVFDPIRNRLKKKKGLVRKNGADYLVYSLLDAIVDHYFLILEEIGEDIEELEDKLITNRSNKGSKISNGHYQLCPCQRHEFRSPSDTVCWKISSHPDS